jgi:Flp pilus assembly protein TadG
MSVRAQRGQAAVEFVAVLPLIAAATLALGHLALAGYALWSAADAARAGARAAHVGADAVAAAERAVPAPFAARAHREGEEVTVRVRAPRLLPVLPRLSVSASSALDPAAGG